MFAALVFLLLLASSQAQDANSLANFVYYNVGNIFQLNELVQIENALAQQACGGATTQQIVDNFSKTVQQNIGGQTAANLLAVGSKLQNDLGNDFNAVKTASANAGVQVLTPVFNDLTQQCPNGVSAFLAQANNYATTQFVQDYLNQVYQAVIGVNPNDWGVCRNDLAQYIYFGNYGY
ncbi:hypothetical protein QR680_014409 [Steinernema hermaphroditum]|uniref:Uncharacterized protein n=1 Tax=Steinernema hermaphroditum TaxID=289476 RepID=A0AA39M467_9BILA|nr:hypothetical protein QR680_014409 [Steinernema hermaphroditum]